MTQALMIQTLDIITVNIWSIIISFANLLVLFLILKMFLYKPVRRMLEARRADIEAQYKAASAAENAALADKKAWNDKMENAQAEADEILKTAEKKADKLRSEIISDAGKKADDIMRRAENEAELERKKAEADIKKKLADVSSVLAEKVLEREINQEDHRKLIDSFINEIGDNDGRNT